MNNDDEIPDDAVMAPTVAAEAMPKNKGGRPRKIRVIDQSQPGAVTSALGAPKRVSAAKLKPESDAPPEGSFLTEDEIKQIRAQARKEALEELKAGQRSALKAKLLKEERVALSPQAEEEIVGFTLEMPSYAMHWPMVIDGVWYFHGKYYEVPLSKYEVFAEQMYRAFEHQRVIDGKSIAEDGRRQYREQQPGQFLSGKQHAAA